MDTRKRNFKKILYELRLERDVMSKFTYIKITIFILFLILLFLLGWRINMFFNDSNIIHEKSKLGSYSDTGNAMDIQRRILQRADMVLLKKYLMENLSLPVLSANITEKDKEKQTESFFRNKIQFLFYLASLKNPEIDKVLSVYYYGEKEVPKQSEKTCAKTALAALLRDYDRIAGRREILAALEDSEFEVFSDIENPGRVLLMEKFEKTRKIPRILSDYIIFLKSEKLNCFFPCDAPAYVKVLTFMDYDDMLKYPF